MRGEQLAGKWQVILANEAGNIGPSVAEIATARRNPGAVRREAF